MAARKTPKPVVSPHAKRQMPIHSINLIKSFEEEDQFGGGGEDLKDLKGAPLAAASAARKRSPSKRKQHKRSGQ